MVPKMTVEFTFDIDSKVDENLTVVWGKWDKYKNEVPNWLQFLKTLPEVDSTHFRGRSTTITFEDDAARNMFLLKWT